MSSVYHIFFSLESLFGKKNSGKTGGGLQFLYTAFTLKVTCLILRVGGLLECSSKKARPVSAAGTGMGLLAGIRATNSKRRQCKLQPFFICKGGFSE